MVVIIVQFWLVGRNEGMVSDSFVEKVVFQLRFLGELDFMVQLCVFGCEQNLKIGIIDDYDL